MTGNASAPERRKFPVSLRESPKLKIASYLGETDEDAPKAARKKKKKTKKLNTIFIVLLFFFFLLCVEGSALGMDEMDKKSREREVEF